MPEGGRNALCGFVYQIVAANGLSARAESPANPDDPCYNLILSAKAGKIVHEHKDQDVVIKIEGTLGTSLVVVQYKHVQNTATEFNAGQLRDVLWAFDRFRKNVGGGLYVDEYVLITNSCLNSPARKAWDNRQTPFTGLVAYKREWLNPKTEDRATVLKEYQTIDEAMAAWYAILQLLTVYENVTSQGQIKGLQAYALAHGVLLDDFQNRLDKLIGATLRTATEGETDFTKEWLNEHLIGFPDARSLDLAAKEDAAHHQSQLLVQHWLETTPGVPSDHVVEREGLTELETQLAQFPVVLLVGGGGCGKSVLAAACLLREAGQRFVACVSASELNATWLGTQFNLWRSPTRGETLPPLAPDEVLRRIRLVNDQRARLLIAVDGWDERGKQDAAPLRELIHLAHRAHTDKADLVLLLTSRSPSADSQRARRTLIRRLFPTDNPELTQHLFGIYTIDYFNETEFLRLLDRMERPLAERMKTALQLGNYSASDFPMYDNPDTSSWAATDTGRSLLLSLRHPVVWGHFFAFAPDIQEQILEGDPAFLYDLAARLSERFSDKVSLRHFNFSADRVQNALRRVAHCEPLQQSRDEWVRRARGPLNDEEASILFDEAASYGIITEDEDGHFLWRHHFLVNWLKNQGGSA